MSGSEISAGAGVEFLRTALGDTALTRAGAALPPVQVPWSGLAQVPGWVVWLGHPPVPADLSILPVPAELIWDDPLVALTTTAVVSIDYALHRSRATSENWAEVLRREAPVAVVVPGDVHPNLVSAIAAADRIGIPIIRGAADLPAALASLPSFAARRGAHSSPVSRPHDPALSFQTVDVAGSIGGNSLSSFVLHHEGERDEVTVIGDLSTRFAVEIGVYDTSVGLQETMDLEVMAATYPSFFNGVSSRIEGHSLAVSWAEDCEPSPTDLGEVIRAWLKALAGMSVVDVRIAFAPPQGRSALLTDMRARAAAFKELRLTAAP